LGVFTKGFERMQVSKNSFFLIVLLIGLSSSLFAKTAHSSHKKYIHVATTSKSNWFLSGGGGVGWISLNSYTAVPNGSFADPPYNNDLYSINSPNTTTAQVNFGYRWNRKKVFIPKTYLFLQYRHYFQRNITGNVQQYSLPEFLNYTYTMPYSADLVTLTGKFDLYEFKKILPYVSIGGGFIINTLSGYNETAFSGVTPRINPGFKGSQQLKGAVTLGAGFDFNFTKDVWATLGYEHVFQGSLVSGAGVGSWSQTNLNFGNIKMDNVFLTISANLPQI
jgi:opacity protein-like surface antigen